MPKINVLHITYDLRDRLNREKTTAVKNLIEISKNWGNPVVIDLVRVPQLKQECTKILNPYYTKIDSFGLPYGILLKWSLNRVLKKILSQIDKNEFYINSINVIHSHKLTYEGLIGYNLSRLFNIPLAITLRQTDSRVLRNKPHMIKLYKNVLSHCSKVYYLNPYSLIDLSKILGNAFYEENVKGKTEILPNIIDINPSTNVFLENSSRLLTIARMTKESTKRKNIHRLLQAISEIENENIQLDIIGEGDYLEIVKGWVKKLGLNKRVRFLGKIENARIKEYLVSSFAFVLPSLSESFGMVYAESLMCGVPILYSKDRLGFDGFFENVGVAVNATSVNSIKQGLLNLLIQNQFYRNQIIKLKESNSFDIFTKTYIESHYLKTLSKIVSNEP